jgi:hypothetical protein
VLRLANIITIIALLCCLAPFSRVAAQTDAIIRVTPLLDPVFERMTFDVTLHRVSDKWQFWANVSLRIESVDLQLTGGFNPGVHVIALLPGTSDLPLVPYTPGAMNGYYIDAGFVNGQIKIHVIGPDSVDDAISVVNPDSIKIGQFTVTSNDKSFVPEVLAVSVPVDYFQANAFKIDHDSATGAGANSNVWYVKHDNPPLITEYLASPPPPDICDAVFEFTGQYEGDLKVGLQFKVSDEHCYEGFWIERSLVKLRDLSDLNFEQRPQLLYQNEPRLLSCKCLLPQVHDSLYDMTEYRREIYAYRLIGQRLPNYGDTAQIIDTIFVRIPNAIISNARLLDNPFKDETTVRFNIDDRLYLTAKVFDLGGRLIGTLLDESGEEIVDKEYAAGVGYRALWKAPDVASQGLYNVVLIGIPFRDDSIEQLSRVILKAQLIR